MKNTIILYVVIFCTVGFYGKAQIPEFTTLELQQILNQPSVDTQFSISNTGKFEIEFPSNLSSSFQALIAQEMLIDLELDVCDNAEVSVQYNVEFNNEFVLSIRKTTSIFNCYATAVDYQEYLNYISYQGKLYSVQLDRSKDIKIYRSSRGLLPSECTVDETEVESSIYFCDNKVFLKEFYDKICQRDVELITTVDYFNFQEL